MPHFSIIYGLLRLERGSNACSLEVLMIVMKCPWIDCSLRAYHHVTIGETTSLVPYHIFQFTATCLTHWGRVIHICLSKQTIIGSDNGLSPGQHQAIIWTNAGILLSATLGTNFSETLIAIRIFSFKKMGLKVSSAKWQSQPQCVNSLWPSDAIWCHWCWSPLVQVMVLPL